MKELRLSKSDTLIQFQVIAVAILAVVLVIISFLLLRGTRELLGIDITLLGWLVRIFIVILAVGVVYATKLFGKNKTYTLKDDKLTISHKSFGPSKNRDVIKLVPESIVNVNIQQSGIQKMLGVGTVAITLDRFSGESVYKIEGIDNPQQVLNWLEERQQKSKSSES